MHKSPPAGFIVDCKTGGLESATAFWGGELGCVVRAKAAAFAAEARTWK